MDGGKSSRLASSSGPQPNVDSMFVTGPCRCPMALEESVRSEEGQTERRGSKQKVIEQIECAGSDGVNFGDEFWNLIERRHVALHF
jgi:hypothetical protein